MSAERATADWASGSVARDWARSDMWADLLRLPRQLAVAIVRHETPTPTLIVDVGSGPGDLLGMFLDAFPGARGVWMDVSPPMQEMARAALAPFGDRVTYVLRDMTEIASVAEAHGADVIMTARAAHHLQVDGLRSFYRDAAGLLRDGGWLVDLDHTETSAEWTRRYVAVRPPFIRPAVPGAGHAHPYPFVSPQVHLDALRDAGIADPAIPWAAFSLCLFMGQRAER